MIVKIVIGLMQLTLELHKFVCPIVGGYLVETKARGSQAWSTKFFPHICTGLHLASPAAPARSTILDQNEFSKANCIC